MPCSIKGWSSAAVIAAIVASALPVPRASMALRAGGWIDVASGRLHGPSVLIVDGDTIRAIVEPDRFSPPDGSDVIDLGGAILLPGLIDAHVHLQIGGPPAVNAAAALDAGFTTVVDLGATSHDVLALRAEIDAGRARGPRMLAAGLWAGTKDGVCEFGGIGIGDGPNGFRRRVAENIAAGADLIKVCVSAWPGATVAQPDAYEIADASLAALVSEAHARKRPVIAHAISAGAVRAAIEKDVDGLAHAAFLDAAAIRRMRERGMFLIPTLASLLPGTPADARAALAGAVRAAHEGGVRLVFGTDAGVLPHGLNAREFTAMTRAGIPGIEAIRAATVNAAAAFHLEQTGELRAGARADIIAVRGNPLDTPDVLMRPAFVMQAGRVVKAVQ